jgi:hypothetical protein
LKARKIPAAFTITTDFIHFFQVHGKSVSASVKKTDTAFSVRRSDADALPVPAIAPHAPYVKLHITPPRIRTQRKLWR